MILAALGRWQRRGESVSARRVADGRVLGAAGVCGEPQIGGAVAGE
jgi:hypothetical protein